MQGDEKGLEHSEIIALLLILWPRDGWRRVGMVRYHNMSPTAADGVEVVAE